MYAIYKWQKAAQNKQNTRGWFQPCEVDLKGSGELLCLQAPTDGPVLPRRSLQHA